MALIRLDQEIGRRTGYLGYRYIPSIEGVIGHLAGYPRDLDDKQGNRLYYSFGPIERATKHQVVYHFSDAKGESGAGLYRLEPDGTGSVFAVDSWSSETDNEACRIDETELIALTFAIKSKSMP